jgi:hypothetical protein
VAAAALPTPRGWSRPGADDDEGRFLTSRTDWSAFTVAGTAPDLHRLPFEPPPPRLTARGRHPCRGRC